MACNRDIFTLITYFYIDLWNIVTSCIKCAVSVAYPAFQPCAHVTAPLFSLCEHSGKGARIRKVASPDSTFRSICQRKHFWRRHVCVWTSLCAWCEHSGQRTWNCIVGSLEHNCTFSMNSQKRAKSVLGNIGLILKAGKQKELRKHSTVRS
jgi:hypothetical protein